MIKRLKEEIQEFVGGVLNRYLCDCDVDFLISIFSDDIVWLGTRELQKAEGKEAVATCFLAGREGLSPCDTYDEVYEVRCLGDGCYPCEGASRLQPKEGTGVYIKVQQRVILVFQKQDGGLKVVHIHNSVPSQDIQEGELFPAEAGREEYLRLKGVLKRRWQEYKQQADSLSQLYNSVPCGTIQFSMDPRHRVVNINRMVWELYGYGSEEEYHTEVKSLVQLVRDEDRVWIVGLVDSLSLDGENVSYIHQGSRRNGQPVWLSMVMGRIVNADGPEVIQAVLTDITGVKCMEQEQGRQQLTENRSLRIAICTAYLLIVSVNLTKDTYNCSIEEQNAYSVERQGRYLDMASYSAPLIYPSYREDFVAAFDRDSVSARFASGERELYMELQQIGMNGVYHWISVQLIYAEDPLNEDVLVIDLVKVLDSQCPEQARQEQLLRDALASAKATNRAKSDFLSRMSHDIRTPMNAIIDTSTIGQLKLEGQKSAHDCFRKIDVSSRYLLSLINDILDMSKIETGKMDLTSEYFDFTKLIGEIDQIIYPQAREERTRYEIYRQEPLEQYYIGDTLRVKQVLMNPLSNAPKFTTEGDSIQVCIQEQKRINGFSYIQFCVKNAGTGMSEELRIRIFQSPEQESPEVVRSNVGSGLDLSTVHDLVQLMGGTIEVESGKNKGTAFTATILLKLIEDGRQKEQQGKQRELMKGLNVLVVDDDPVVGCQCTEILRDVGVVYVWVDSGSRAVGEANHCLRSGKYYHIVMIDWQMPDMDGVETARWIRSLVGPDTTIIAISAYDWTAIKQEARGAGVDYFISKLLFRSSIYDASVGAADRTLPAVEKVERTDPRYCRAPLAEDNELNREITKTLLEMHGMEVETAHDGQEALDLFEKNGAGYYDAVLTDIRTPVMDGLEVTRSIRALAHPDGGKVPTLAMTANAFEEDKVMAYKAGMTGYLVKPLDIDLVLDEPKKFV